MKTWNKILSSGLIGGWLLGTLTAIGQVLPDEALVAEEIRTEILSLEAGWNLVALPVSPADTAIASVLAQILSEVDGVWAYDAAASRWEGYHPQVPGLNDLQHLAAGTGFWIRMKSPAAWEITGLPSVNAPNTPGGKSLPAGWNLIGYSSGLSQPVSTALAPLEGRFSEVYGFDAGAGQWRLVDPANSEDRMHTAKGYWVNLSEPGVWTAPNFEAVVTDTQTGEPVAGAMVSMDGIEAEEPTGADGHFRILGIPESDCQLLTINKKGYRPISQRIDTTQSGVLVACDEAPPAIPAGAIGFYESTAATVIGVEPLPAPAVTDILSPEDKAHYRVAPGCTSASMPVRGYASLDDLSTLYFDIALVIDTSGSTSNPTGFDLDHDGVEDTLLEAELAACRRLIDMLGGGATRFSVIKFARLHEKTAPAGGISTGPVLTQQTRIVQPMTTDRTAVLAALDVVAGEGSAGGTHTSAGIDLALRTLADAPPANSSGVQPLGHVILITDGAPTLPIESGYTQERGDRQAVLEAAQRAADANIAVHPVVIDPASKEDRKLTTMPAVQAITGVPGELPRLNSANIDRMGDILAALPLTDINRVEVYDKKAKITYPVAVRPNGYFETTLPVAIDKGELEINVYSDNEDKPTTHKVKFEVHAGDAPVGSEVITANQLAVTELTSLEKPAGGAMDGNLLSLIQEEYEEAFVLPGVEGWHTTDYKFKVNFRYKNSDWASEVGYFEFDPVNPPQTAQEVLATLTPDNVILHSGDFDNGWIKEDEYVRVPENSTIGFFIVPNGTLEEALTGEGNAPLFTIAHLNPGHFDQVVTFWDPYKEQIIFSYEETEIQGNRSDQDFADILFLIDGKDPLGIQLHCAE